MTIVEEVQMPYDPDYLMDLQKAATITGTSILQLIAEKGALVKSNAPFLLSIIDISQK